MKVGDILIYINGADYDNQSYTVGKQYVIFKIDNIVSGQRCGWIKDDKNQDVYFTEEEMFDENWKSIKYVRKIKLKKLCQK
jgi:hypothetical protein